MTDNKRVVHPFLNAVTALTVFPWSNARPTASSWVF